MDARMAPSPAAAASLGGDNAQLSCSAPWMPVDSNSNSTRCDCTVLCTGQHVACQHRAWYTAAFIAGDDIDNVSDLLAQLGCDSQVSCTVSGSHAVPAVLAHASMGFLTEGVMLLDERSNLVGAGHRQAQLQCHPACSVACCPRNGAKR